MKLNCLFSKGSFQRALLVGILLQFVVWKSLGQPALEVFWAVLTEVDLGTPRDLHRLLQAPSRSLTLTVHTCTRDFSRAAIQAEGILGFPPLWECGLLSPNVLFSAAYSAPNTQPAPR